MGFLEKFLGQPNIESLQNKCDVKGLVKALQHKEWTIRRDAAIALGNIGDSHAVEPLSEVYKNECIFEGSYAVREATVTAIGKIGDNSAIKFLLDALGDRHEGVRHTAISALIGIGDTVVTPLGELAMSKDVSDDTMEATIEILGKIGGTRSVEILASLLLMEARESLLTAKEKAAVALGQIGDRRAVEPLIAALTKRDTVPDTRNGIFIGSEYMEVGTRGYDPVRKSAALALIKIGKSSVEPLIALLKDKNSPGRLKAAEALGEIKDSRAVEPLIEALKDSSGWVKIEAAKALGKLRNRQAIEPLIEVIKKDKDYRREAAKALKAITGQKFGEDGRQWQEWWDKNKAKI